MAQRWTTCLFIPYGQLVIEFNINFNITEYE